MNNLSSHAVYLIDDDLLVLSAVDSALQSYGYSPQTFSSATDLLKVIDPSRTGVVITDLQMPKMDGVELQRKLMEQDCNLSLIFLTAHASVSVTVEVMKNGATTLIEKPFNVEHLMEEVAKALEASQNKQKERARILVAIERLAKLSAEELAVMDLAANGKPNKVIGQELSLSNRTVDRRRQLALQKLNVNSIAEFAVLREIAEKE